MGKFGPPHRPMLWAASVIGIALLLSLPTGASALVAGSRPLHADAHGTSAELAGALRGPGPLTRTPPAIAAVPDWINVTSSAARTPPGIGLGSSMAYDPLVGAYVYFGGCTTTSCPANQTWTYSSGHWQNVTSPRDAPPARAEASMDFDANAGGVLLFGGVGSGGQLNDTWIWTASGWSNETRVSGIGPSARDLASLAFDPANDTNGTILFGGQNATTPRLNDTWIWQPGSGWNQLSPVVSPPARYLAQMAYDGGIAGLVLFSGYQSCVSGTCSSADTWEWWGGSWWKVFTDPTPDGRIGAFFSADSSLGTLLLFGGYNATNATYLSDTWEFGPSGWQADSPAHHPSGRLFPAGAPEAGPGGPILYSGTAAYGVSLGTFDTWVYEIAPSASIMAGPNAEANAPVSFSISIGGGSPPYQTAVTFGDGTNGSIPSSGGNASITHTYLTAGSYPVSVRVWDGTGASTGVNSSVTVVAGPSVRAVAAPTGTDIGHPIQFTAVTVARGVVPDQYFWNWADGTNSTSANASHTFASAGTHLVQLRLTDGVGGVASSSVTVTVNPLPTTAIQWTPSAPKTGAPTVLSANRTGGTAPFSYAWLLGDGSSSTAPSPSHFYSHVGTYTVQLWLNDSSGVSVHQSQSISVAAGLAQSSPSTNSSSPPPIPIWFWPGIAGLAVVAVVGSYLLLRRKPVEGGEKPGTPSG